MIVKRRVVAPVAEVQMLRDPLMKRRGLPDVDAHVFVEAEDPVEVDGTRVRAQTAAYRFQGIKGPATGDVGPYLWAYTEDTEVIESGVSLDPFAIAGIVF